jgi:hypothetical protein
MIHRSKDYHASQWRGLQIELLVEDEEYRPVMAPNYWRSTNDTEPAWLIKCMQCGRMVEWCSQNQTLRCQCATRETAPVGHVPGPGEKLGDPADYWKS